MQTRNSPAQLSAIYTHSSPSWKASISKAQVDSSKWKSHLALNSKGGMGGNKMILQRQLKELDKTVWGGWRGYDIEVPLAQT